MGFQFLRIWRRLLTPTLDFNAHDSNFATKGLRTRLVRSVPEAVATGKPSVDPALSGDPVATSPGTDLIPKRRIIVVKDAGLNSSAGSLAVLGAVLDPIVQSS